MSKVHSTLSIIRRADSFPRSRELQVLTAPSPSVGLPLLIGQTPVGWVCPQVISLLTDHPTVFQLHSTYITLNPALTTPDARTQAIDTILRQWKAEQKFVCLKGWRDEAYDVFADAANGRREVVMRIERSAVGVLGMRAYGCHLNGYVRDASGDVKMWIARRSETKQTYPGMLDNLVGGGLPAGTKPHDNIVKECHEEANIPASLARKARPVGATTFFLDSEERGWIPDTEYIYDLELPADFVPTPVDGEVQAFYLWSLEEVKEHLHLGEFMPESGLVIVDFLVRHGYMNASNEPDYVDVLSAMRRHLPFPGPTYT
ncbi:hypothetical protein HK104_010680 [Borealophlyctis nickersoniae]|nr:hypothetical protein HK104_010680 [Borealophlyctis nickersoniae]